MPVPRVVAKGRGETGEAILALAREHGVPIEENAPLAEALSQVELGEDIPEALYRAVAEVLIFILRASGRSLSLMLRSVAKRRVSKHGQATASRPCFETLASARSSG